MPGVTRAGADSAIGAIGGGIASVQVNGNNISVSGDPVAPHPPPPIPHQVASMAGGSSTVFAAGISVIRAGDAATCGHAATGSSNVNAG